jgi:hypothetical protein
MNAFERNLLKKLIAYMIEILYFFFWTKIEILLLSVVFYGQHYALFILLLNAAKLGKIFVAVYFILHYNYPFK